MHDRELGDEAFKLRELEDSEGENLDMLKDYEPKAQEYKMMLGQSSVKKFDSKL